MKKNKFAMISVTFLLGVVFGVSLFAILAFTRAHNPAPYPVGTKIKWQEARSIFSTYMASAQIITDEKPKGYTIDKEILKALNDLADPSNPTQRFRIYTGKDPKGGATQGIVLCVDAAGLDDYNGIIYKTNSPDTGPCPFLCDYTSEIIKGVN